MKLKWKKLGDGDLHKWWADETTWIFSVKIPWNSEKRWIWTAAYCGREPNCYVEAVSHFRYKTDKDAKRACEKVAKRLYNLFKR